jgi:hypothetical protein
VSERKSTIDAPFTATGREIKNSFGLVVATCVDPAMAADMAEGLTLLRKLCERAWPGRPPGMGTPHAEVPVPLLQEARTLLGLREQGWETARRSKRGKTP